MVMQLARQRGNRSESLPPLSLRFSQSIFRSSFLSRLREGASAHAGGVGTPYLFHLPSGGVSRFVYPSSTELPWVGRRGLARMRNERVIVQLLSFGGSFGSVWPFHVIPPAPFQSEWTVCRRKVFVCANLDLRFVGRRRRVCSRTFLAFSSPGAFLL